MSGLQTAVSILASFPIPHLWSGLGCGTVVAPVPGSGGLSDGFVTFLCLKLAFLLITFLSFAPKHTLTRERQTALCSECLAQTPPLFALADSSTPFQPASPFGEISSPQGHGISQG